MKKFCLFVQLCAVLFFVTPILNAQTLKGMSLNGSTGLVSIPTARVSWDASYLGLDLGYHTIIKKDIAHIPAIGISFLKMVEISGAFDIQPGSNESGFILGGKIQFPIENTALALGGNFQLLNMWNSSLDRMAGQIYLAVTYSGHFFNWPAETTVVLGKTFIKNHPDTNIDFGMGFDMILFPSVLKNYVHWIMDFANFSYSAEPTSADHRVRGVLNTGFRIDLSAVPVFSKINFVVDVLMTDAFDSNRAFSIGLVLGVPLL
jgi:hypothetical protein